MLCNILPRIRVQVRELNGIISHMHLREDQYREALRQQQEALDAKEGDKKKAGRQFPAACNPHMDCPALPPLRRWHAPCSIGNTVHSATLRERTTPAALLPRPAALQALRSLKKTRMELDSLAEELAQVGAQGVQGRRDGTATALHHASTQHAPQASACGLLPAHLLPAHLLPATRLPTCCLPPA